MTKITIVGAGYVGATAAYALLLKGIGTEIALVDINKAKVEGEALDLKNGITFMENAKIAYSDSYEVSKDSDIIVITAGLNQKPGETRLDLVAKNAKIMKSIVTETEKYNENAVYMIVSNPVDVLTAVAKKYVKHPDKVLGSGTTLDTSRLRDFISSEVGVNPLDIETFILGEHGDSSFPLWSSATVGGVPIHDLSEITEEKLNDFHKRVKESAYEIISKKGATYYAIGIVIATLCQSIIYDQKKVFPVSTHAEQYRISDICLSVPCIIGRNGVERKLHLALNEREEEQLKASADILREALAVAEKAVEE